MHKIVKGIFCLLLIMASFEATAEEMGHNYAANEVTIPGYTPPPPSTPPTTPQSDSTSIQSNMSDPAEQAHVFPTPKPSPEMMHKSCERLIPVTLPLESTLFAFKNKYEETNKNTIYRWPREGEPNPNLDITFTEDGTPVSFKGNLPITLPNASDLQFSLADVQRVLSSPGKIIGYSYTFTNKKQEGNITVNTDMNNIVTSFTTEIVCE